MISTRYNLGYSFLLLLNTCILFFSANNFSISFKEVNIYFEATHKLLYYITHFSTAIFGQNDIALRLPFILFYILSVILLHLLTRDYFKKPIDRFISSSIFMFLPGVYSAALLVNEAIIVIFATLLYLYLKKITQKEQYILLILYLFIDNSFAILYLALFVYSLKQKDNKLLVFSLVLFGISMSIYGFDIQGHPRGYFLDTFGIYASIFSPILFLYFFYVIYRVGIKYDKDIYWYISATALCFSFILSFRQKINIEDFAPFVVISVPVMVKVFMHSLRIRLKIYRKKYYFIAFLSIFFLSLNILLFIFNKYLYIFLDNPKKHFAYKYYIAKELAVKLHNLHINSVYLPDNKLQKRLKFYNIDKIKLSSTKLNNKIIIKYYDKAIQQIVFY